MPNPFLEERLSECVLIGSTWSDDYTVEITRTAGEQEHRRLVQPYPLRRFTIAYIDERMDFGSQIFSLYSRAYGKFAGFRFKAHDDFTTAADGVSAHTALDEILVTLGANTVQMVKRYGTGVSVPVIGRPLRTIFKPVAGTVLVARNGTPLATPADFTVDTATGIVTLVAPVGADTITGGCQFDLPMRFDSSLPTEYTTDVVRTAQAELVELINP